MTNGKKAKKQKSGGAWLLELVVIVAVAVGLAFTIQLFIVKPFRIPSGSMLPTLKIGERVLANRFLYRFSDPKRFNIIVFHPPQGEEPQSCGVNHSPLSPCPKGTSQRASVNFIKRVVGLPGDRLSIRYGRVYINGKLNDTDKASFCNDENCTQPRPARFCNIPQCNMPRPIKIPAGYYFMMGDNRGNSADSRFWGPVPRDWLIGEAFFSYWPPSQFGPL